LNVKQQSVINENKSSLFVKFEFTPEITMQKHLQKHKFTRWPNFNCCIRSILNFKAPTSVTLSCKCKLWYIIIKIN